jgi:DNA-binding GntR family transcriptional regulator
MALGARTPQYALVAGRLMASIREGRYRPGTLLPAESALCEQFGVSRITVRAAMKELELRGLVSRRPGIGTRVEAATAPERFVHSADTIEGIMQFTAGLSFQVLKAESIRADEELALRLDWARGQELLRVSGLRVERSGRPVCSSVHYIASAYAVPARELQGRTGSIAVFLAKRQGEEIAEARQIIEARNLSSAQARVLKAKPREAALATRRWYYTATGRLLIVTESLFPQGRYTYSVRMRRERLPPAQQTRTGNP